MTVVKRWHLLVGGLAFFLNPTLACIGEDEFEYDAADMLAAIEGTWQATLTYDDGRSGSLTFVLRQGTGAQASGPAAGRGLVRSAAACTGRVFVRTASACTSSTSMPLEGTFLGGDEAFRSVSIGGDLTVFGLKFTGGMLTLSVGDLKLETSHVTPDGQVSNVQIRDPSLPNAIGMATLVRLGS